MKYDFIPTIDTGNVFVNMLIYVNQQVHGFLVYAIVFSILIVFTFVFLKVTQDITLSMTRSLFITIIMSMLFYYMGKSYGVDLFSGSLLILMILGLSTSVGIMMYQRNKVV